MRNNENKSLPDEKVSKWFTKKIDAISSISEQNRNTIEAIAHGAFMKYDDFLNAQEDKRLNAERIFSEFRQYFNQFIKSLHAGIGINEQFEIFSNFAEGIAKCRQERKKYKKELTAQQEREIERLAYCRPLRPFPEETRRLIEEYRKKRRQGR